MHRDVKPANLIAAEKDGGVLKLIDLGAAAMCLGDNPLNYYPVRRGGGGEVVDENPFLL